MSTYEFVSKVIGVIIVLKLVFRCDGGVVRVIGTVFRGASYGECSLKECVDVGMIY